MSYEEIAIELLADDEVITPHYGSEGASGADVRAHILEDIIVPPHKSVLVPTGVHLAIPEGYEIQVRPRSGLAAKNQITVLNTPGTIDSDYRGEIKVILMNHSDEPFVVHPGMRIAQLVLTPVCKAIFLRKSDLSSTARGAGGFGHTGLK